MMLDDAPPEWAEEIRDYLLGRIASPSVSGPLREAQRTSMRPVPIRRWWLFEGKRYACWRSPLKDNWADVERQVRLLLRSFNPALRISERPEGIVDWGRPLARGPGGVSSEFIVQSSRIGIDELERAALVGWANWIATEWTAYCERFGMPAHEILADVLREAHGRGPGAAAAVPSLEQLQRWAHVARRSRWPVLHDVVAESLRVLLEPQDVERIPLPASRDALFELLCLVRIGRASAPRPDELRWVDRELTGNRVDLPGGLRCHYQYDLGREAVLRCSEYGDGLAEAATVFDLGVPRRVDLVFEFACTLRRGMRTVRAACQDEARAAR